ncbi:MAG: class I SAM-dependent methyltransferase [Vampirovibrio sp.]|nr:class I SAM-dependent methyltransferase [Vampirovibrio sp.]
MSVTGTPVLPDVKVDENRSDAFAAKMMTMVNHGGLALMMSIGHRTGLFDVMAQMPPATQTEIALAASLNERYVQEWLSAMVVGKVVDYDATNKIFHLPAEHAGWLTRSSSPDNLAVMTQFFSVLGSVEDEIVDCFQNGGGVPYSSYHRFHEVMAEESAQTVVAGLKENILSLVPGLIDKLTAGITVLDVGCGSGRAVNQMAKLFPKSAFVGYDLSEEAIQNGKTEATQMGLTNSRFQAKNATDFGDAGTYDLITAFDAIHDQARPDLVLSQIHQALKQDGIFLMQDIAGSSYLEKNKAHPLGTFLYTISCLHCMTVSLAQPDGMGLGALWGEEQAVKMLNDAGFSKVDVEQLPHDFMNNYYVAAR